MAKKLEKSPEPGNEDASSLSKTEEQPAEGPEDEDALTDHELIALIRNGNTEAFEELMERYAGKGYQIAYGILGHRHDAEEVIQDAFVRIFRALPKFRGEAEFSTWMYRIVVNQARNKYRWNRRRGAGVNLSIHQPKEGDSKNELTIDLPDQSKTPDHEMIFKEWKGEIAREIESLPEVNREALILRNVKNMSYERIASVLKCKIGTVKSRIARAREELRKRLDR